MHCSPHVLSHRSPALMGAAWSFRPAEQPRPAAVADLSSAGSLPALSVPPFACLPGTPTPRRVVTRLTFRV